MWYYAKDGQQEGPIEQESLVEMLQQRRIASDALVWREGMAQWLPANQVAEFSSALAAPAPSSSGLVAQPPPGMAYAQPLQTNNMALTSMVLGICGIVVAGIFTAIPAIICGHIARKQIREAKGTQTGEGMATAGLITGYLATILTLVVVIGIIFFIIYVVNAAPSPSAPFPPSAPPPPVVPGPVPMPAPTAP